MKGLAADKAQGRAGLWWWIAMGMKGQVNRL